jgi:hypothetical protein
MLALPMFQTDVLKTKRFHLIMCDIYKTGIELCQCKSDTISKNPNSEYELLSYLIKQPYIDISLSVHDDVINMFIKLILLIKTITPDQRYDLFAQLFELYDDTYQKNLIFKSIYPAPIYFYYHIFGYYRKYQKSKQRINTKTEVKHESSIRKITKLIYLILDDIIYPSRLYLCRESKYGKYDLLFYFLFMMLYTTFSKLLFCINTIPETIVQNGLTYFYMYILLIPNCLFMSLVGLVCIQLLTFIIVQMQHLLSKNFVYDYYAINEASRYLLRRNIRIRICFGLTLVHFMYTYYRYIHSYTSVT